MIRQEARRLVVQRDRFNKPELDAQEHQENSGHEELITVEFHGE